MNRLIWLGCIAYLLIGLAQVVVGANMPELLSHYGRVYADGGSLIFAQYAGLLAGVLTAPFLSGLWSKRTTLIIAFVSLAFAEIVFVLLPPWALLYPASLVAGFGFGIIEALIGAIIIAGIPDRPAVAISRLEVFFGVGALTMPFIAGWLITFGLWRYSFLLIALLAVACIRWWTKGAFDLAAAAIEQPASVDENKKRTKFHYNRKKTGILMLFIIFFIIYAGVEMSLVNFFPAIFIEKLHADKAFAALSVTCFWAAMAFGRIFSGRIAERMRYGPFLLASSLGTLLATALFAWSGTMWFGLTAALLLGLAMSGMFSVALVFVNALLPGTTDSTTGIVIFFTGIGGALWPLGTGFSMDLVGAESTTWLLVLIAFALTASSAAIYRMNTVAIRQISETSSK